MSRLEVQAEQETWAGCEAVWGSHTYLAPEVMELEATDGTIT